jgi:hypothetical protein
MGRRATTSSSSHSLIFLVRSVSLARDTIEHMFQDTVARAGELIAGVVDALDPDAVSGLAARQLWGEFDRIERLSSAGKTLLARRIAQTHQRNSGTRSAAEELSRRSGTSTGQAKDSVDTSQRLPDQPQVTKALRRGDLSPAQAALISDAAAANPAEEHRLTELAGQVSLAELREECARVKAAADPDPDATNRRIHAARRLRHYRDAEGGWNLTARGTAQAGAAFLTVLNAITDTIFRQTRRDGRNEPVEAYAFDALMVMAQHAASDGAEPGAAHNGSTADTAHDAPPAGSGEPADDAATRTGAGQRSGDDTCADRPSGNTETTRAGAGLLDPHGAESAADGDPGIFQATTAAGRSICPVPASRWSNPRYLALLRIDVAALRRGRVDGDELCEIAGVGAVPVSVARDLLGEAIIKLVITRGVDVLNVTHLGRGPTAAQHAALLWTNPTCAVQGCTRRRIEYDHQIPWAETKHTRLDELDPLCTFHHDLKTRHGWALIPGTGKRALVPPDDPRHPKHLQARPPTGRPPRPRPTGPDTPPSRTEPTGPNSARRGTRRRAAANAQTTLPDPPGDPP